MNAVSGRDGRVHRARSSVLIIGRRIGDGDNPYSA